MSEDRAQNYVLRDLLQTASERVGRIETFCDQQEAQDQLQKLRKELADAWEIAEGGQGGGWFARKP